MMDFDVDLRLEHLNQEAERKKALILCNGDPPSAELLQKYAEIADEIYCCDGAARYLDEYGMGCDVLVGDFDSLGGEDEAKLYAEKWNARLEILPTKKNETDSQIAMEIAIKAGAKELIFLGALGGRFDMALANAQMLCLCKLKGADGVVVDDQNEIRASCTHAFIHGKIGSTVSFLPLGVQCKIRCTDGLEYPIYDMEMNLGDTRCISNVMLEERAYIEMSHGWILIIQSKDK